MVSMAIFMFSTPHRRVEALSFTSATRSFTQRQQTRLSPLFALSSDDMRDFSNYEADSTNSRRKLQMKKSKWIERSTTYYSTIMRNESRRARGQIKRNTLESHRNNFVIAKMLYVARNKIKAGGSLSQAEFIYRKLIDELMDDDNEHCDHAQLAISTLLLALLLQRKENITETRQVFDRFFSTIHRNIHGNELECTCSAKVLQAYALFEMKQGNVKKAYMLAETAVRMDNELHPLLQWKLFRDAKLAMEI
jgi:tetratricopeptide (TPR) repeat protein